MINQFPDHSLQSEICLQTEIRLQPEHIES